MTRVLVLMLVVVASVGWLPEFASAQDWPSYQTGPTPDIHLIERGPGWYFAIWKPALVIVSFLVWVKLADFVNRDAQQVAEQTDMPAEVWNPVMVFSFFVGFLLVLTLPFFLLGFPLYLAAVVAPFAFYVVQRNSKVPADETIFTRAHRVRRKAEKAAGHAGGPAPNRPLPQDAGSPLEFKPIGGDSVQAQAAFIRARQIPAFVYVKDLIYQSLMLRADQLLLDYTRDRVVIRQQIDGVYHTLPELDRHLGDAMLMVLKLIAQLDPDERRERQEGRFSISIPEKKFEGRLATQGVKTGERVLLKFVGKKQKPLGLSELGMHPKVEKRLKEFLNSPGFVLVGCRPGDGMTTSWNAVLRSADRITRDFHGIIKPDHEDTEAENIDLHVVEPKSGKTPEELLKSLQLRLPEAYVVPDLMNGNVIDRLASEVNDKERFVISRMQGASLPELIVRTMAMKPDRAAFAKSLTAVLYWRLARRLCDYCKQPYQPSPQLLKKLRLRPEQVPQLYREYQPPPPEELVDEKGRPIEPPVCQVCGGLGYIGRVAIYELLVIDDAIRRTMVKEPSLEKLAETAREQGHQGLQATGLQLVVAGVTSLSEIQRVLKT